MCFKAKVKTPKVQTAQIVAPTEPLKDAPSGVKFGGGDDEDNSSGTGSSEVAGVSSLKIKADSSIDKEQADSTKKVSGTAKKAVRQSVFNSGK